MNVHNNMRLEVAVLCASTLIACGSQTAVRGTSVTEDGPRYTPTRAPPLPDFDRATAEASGTQQMYTGRVHLEVDEVDETIDRVTAYFDSAGVQIVAREAGLLVARVHADDYEATMRGLDGYGRVAERRSRAGELAAKYERLEAQRKTVLIERKRLEVMLGTTSDVKTQARLLDEIDDVTAELETLSAEVAALEPVVVVATIHVVFSVA